jgi:hypothetical protein
LCVLLGTKLREQGINLPRDVITLSQQPYMMARRYNSYFINGCTYHTHSYGVGKSTQCDGVAVVASTSSFSSAKDDNPAVGDVLYYGRITDIIELNYSNEGHVVLFKCDWVKKTV